MKNGKLNVKKTLLLSFGFFASSIAWSVYNAYVPLLLERFIESTVFIGFIMTFDNIFGAVFQPLFGRLSDKTRTRFGRRMPYIFVGIPVCAAAFTVVPRMVNLPSLMAVLIIFNFVMSAWRSPVVALMPDITPGPLRSQANGIVNLMGGVGSLLAFLGGGILFNIGGYPLPFLISAVLMVGSLLVLALFVREPADAYRIKEEPAVAEPLKVKLDRGEKKSLLLILLGVFFWFAAYNAVETFFTLYATNSLGMGEGAASMTLAIFSLTFLAFALPAGFIGAKIGRRRAILIGLTGLVVLFLPLLFLSNVWAVRVCLFLGGFFWAFVNINSLPMVVRLSGDGKVGTFIGYYYFFSFSSQIVSPILFGYIRDLTGDYKTLFLYSCIAFAVAAVSLFFVRHGEEPEQKPEAADVLSEL
ncbi:MAG: MFS transporter [Oscillospiraceae bacterium]|jgi:MFS family permease|nr:MFS transporter [Oscillospiraceae bacterium]